MFLQLNQLEKASDVELFASLQTEVARLSYDMEKFADKEPKLHWKRKRGSMYFIRKLVCEMESRATD